MSALVLEQLQTAVFEQPRKSGRAVRDHRGDAIWEWQIATGVFERNVTDEQLRRLEASDLRLVESPADRGVRIYESAGAPAQPLRRIPSHRDASGKEAAPRRGFWARIRGL